MRTRGREEVSPGLRVRRCRPLGLEGLAAPGDAASCPRPTPGARRYSLRSGDARRSSCETLAVLLQHLVREAALVVDFIVGLDCYPEERPWVDVLIRGARDLTKVRDVLLHAAPRLHLPWRGAAEGPVDDQCVAVVQLTFHRRRERLRLPRL